MPSSAVDDAISIHNLVTALRDRPSRRFGDAAWILGVYQGHVIPRHQGVACAGDTNVALAVDKTAHPVSSRLFLAEATRSVFKMFRMDLKVTSGTRSGHFAPFAWSA